MALTIAIVAGLAGALFLAGPALFADGSLQERLAVAALLVAILLLGGLGIGYLSPESRRISPWLLAVPTVLISIYFSLDEATTRQLGISLMGGGLGASFAGVLLGARLRLRRAPLDPGPLGRPKLQDEAPR